MPRLPVPVSWDTNEVLRGTMLQSWAAWWPSCGLDTPTDETGWMIVGNEFDLWREAERMRQYREECRRNGIPVYGDAEDPTPG